MNTNRAGVVAINARTDVSKYSPCFLLQRRSGTFLAGENGFSCGRAIAPWSYQLGYRMDSRMYILVLALFLEATISCSGSYHHLRRFSLIAAALALL